MTTAAQWLELDATSRQVLVTVANIRETLTSWTRVGVTTAYSCTWASQTHPGDAKSAYRAISGVMINSSALTQRASLAAVQANASSWFWDDATSTLYVSSASGASPATFSWAGAVFSLFFSSAPIADTVLYEPRVVGALPTLQSEEFDLTLGASSSSSGTLSLTNADGFFDDTAWRYAWHNASVSIRVGGSDMAIGDYISAGQLQIVGSPAPADDVCVFQLRAFDNQPRDRAFPLHTYLDAADASLITLSKTNDLRGQFMPMFWGTVLDIPTVFIKTQTVVIGMTSTTFGYYVFIDLLQDAAAVITAVRAVNRSTGAVTSVDSAYWSVDSGQARINLTTFPRETYDFRVDATRASGQPQTCAGVAADILALTGVPAASISDAAFDAIDAAWPAVIGLYVAGGAAPSVFVSAGTLLRRIEQSSLGRIYVSDSGLWTMDLYDPSIPLSAPEIREELVTRFEPSSTVQEAMALSVRVQYANKIITGAWSTVSSSEATNGHAYQTTEVLNHSTLLTEEHYATLLAGRLAWVNSLPTNRVVIDGPPVCFTLKPRDKVRVIRHRAPGPTGSWTGAGAGMEVEAVTKRPSDCRAEVTVGNMRGIGGAVKIAAPNGTPNWASASALERLLYGFGLDNTTQRADVADASTFRQFRAW